MCERFCRSGRAAVVCSGCLRVLNIINIAFSLYLPTPVTLHVYNSLVTSYVISATQSLSHSNGPKTVAYIYFLGQLLLHPYIYETSGRCQATCLSEG